MRSIKICSALLLFLSFSVSCEKESMDPTENQATVEQDQLTFSEFINSGIDVENYIQTVLKHESSSKSSNKSHTPAGSEEYDQEFFDSFCGNLPVEGFEEGDMNSDIAGIFYGPLNEDTDFAKFEAGDILPGISISAEGRVLGLFGQEVRDTHSKVIYAQTKDANLFIDFTTEDVQSVSLDILSFPYPDSDASQEVTVEVTYNSGETHIEVVTASISGSFWGITGEETISQIALSSTNNDAFIGVDNIAFGLCEDNDGDGCLNEDDDEYPFSNMEATVNIGSCDSGVENRITAECGVFMSDLIDVLEPDDTYRNKGQFVSSVASQTNQWVADGLITELEKDALMSCAAGADIR